MAVHAAAVAGEKGPDSDKYEPARGNDGMVIDEDPNIDHDEADDDAANTSDGISKTPNNKQQNKTKKRPRMTTTKKVSWWWPLPRRPAFPFLVAAVAVVDAREERERADGARPPSKRDDSPRNGNWRRKLVVSRPH
jgi:hypothetical protein